VLWCMRGDLSKSAWELLAPVVQQAARQHGEVWHVSHRIVREGVDGSATAAPFDALLAREPTAEEAVASSGIVRWYVDGDGIVRSELLAGS